MTTLFATLPPFVEAVADLPGCWAVTGRRVLATNEGKPMTETTEFASPPCPVCGELQAMSPTVGFWCWVGNRVRLEAMGQSVAGCPAIEPNDPRVIRHQGAGEPQ